MGNAAYAGKGEILCCETCREYGGDAALAPIPETPPLRAKHDAMRMIVRERGGPTREVLFSQPVVRIGRGLDNEVVLVSGAISRRQCVVEFEADRVAISDAGSVCGTYVDGRPIGEQRVALREGAVVQVGDYELRLELR